MCDKDILSAIKHLTNEVKNLRADVKAIDDKLDSSEIANRTMLEMRWKEVSQKFDIFANLNEQSATNMAKPNTRKVSKPIFFKNLFMTQREEYLDKLFTQEEIDTYMKDPLVVKKTKAEDKFIRIAKYIYDNSIKVNQPEGRLALFESIYTSSTSN